MSRFCFYYLNSIPFRFWEDGTFRGKLISPLEILNIVLGFLLFFYSFLFYFLGNQTRLVRKNPLPCLANFMSSGDATMKVKNPKEWQKTIIY